MKVSVEDRIIEGLEEFTKALKSGKALTEKFNVRRVVLDLKPKSVTPEMVKKTRVPPRDDGCHHPQAGL
jgi:hypothetical protein